MKILKIMIGIFWCSFRHPMHAIVIDRNTGEVKLLPRNESYFWPWDKGRS